MTSAQANQFPPDSEAGRRPAAGTLSRPLGDVGHGAAGIKPRIKMLATEGDLAPAGATFNPPTAAPLPERGAGLHLLLSALAASIAVVFLVLLLHKL